MSFASMWSDLEPIGRDGRTGGYRRYAWTPAERECRAWFEAEATGRGLDVTTDRNGNLWAWLGNPDEAPGRGVVTGSHLDSVPDGGAYDGPLGIISAFAALDKLRTKGVRARRPLGIVAYADEEGARFGIACAGSRLTTGSLDPDTARGLTDAEGRTYAEALRAAGHDPNHLGRDEETLRRIGTFVELHVEQGRGLADLGAPVGLAERIFPHGRWRFDLTGRADHAGAAAMADRADPMLTYAMTALAANKRARLTGARATFGRLAVEPNGTNAIPSRVTAWLDARAESDGTLDDLLGCLVRQSRERSARDTTALEVTEESRTPAVVFGEELRSRLAGTLEPTLGPVPTLPTYAGHDAGILCSAGIPSAMLFVRNPSGVSHSPAEFAERADCLTGVAALATVLEDLLT